MEPVVAERADASALSSVRVFFSPFIFAAAVVDNAMQRTVAMMALEQVLICPIVMLKFEDSPSERP
jgi:hypothetical protein